MITFNILQELSYTEKQEILGNFISIQREYVATKVMKH